MFPVSIKGVLLTDTREAVLALNDRGEWELPGGRLEPGEQPEDTVAREFLEELGVAVTAGALLDSYLFEVIPGKQVFIVTYGCSLSGVFAPTLSHEHTDIRTFAVDALPANLPPGYRRSIEAWHAAVSREA